jgi:hypothetical protein
MALPLAASRSTVVATAVRMQDMGDSRSECATGDGCVSGRRTGHRVFDMAARA